MQPKPASASATTMNEIVLPSDSNNLGTAFGGRVMAWIDICAAIAAQRHCRAKVVTASIDEVHFHAPIRAGMIASLEARVTATFSRSLEVSVTVYSEDPQTGVRNHCCSASSTFAALDDAFKPTAVPPLELITDQDRKRQASADARRAARLQRRRETAAEA